MKYSEVRQIVYNRYHGKCAICGKPLAYDEMTIDHIIPKARGGDGSFSNLQCACETCNTMKHSLTENEFFRKVLAVAVHNARNIFKSYLKGGVSA